MEVPFGVMSLRNRAEAQLADNVFGDADPVASGGPSAVLVRQGPTGNEAAIVDGAVWFDTDDTVAMWWE